MIDKTELKNWVNSNTFVVVDIETTGLNFSQDEIIDLSAIKLKDGQIIDKFTSLCKPQNPITKEIEQLTQITNKMVENSPSSSQVVKAFLQFADNAILVSYNINFDYNFIKECAKQQNIDIDYKTFDCLYYIKQLFPNLKNYRFFTALKALGIKVKADNSTISSATTTSEMFLNLIDILYKKC